MLGKVLNSILLICALAAPWASYAQELKQVQSAPLVTVPLWEAFHPAWRPETGYSELRRIAMDPDQRLEPDFRIPPALIDRVLFWATVYSQFTSRMRIVHDRDDARIMYGYIDYNPLFKTIAPGSADRRVAKLDADIKANLAMAISEMAGASTMTPLSPLDRTLFRQFLAQRERNTQQSLRPLIYNIRTQSGQSDVFQTALERSQPLLPKMEEVFVREGLPKSLAKIPFVESSFNVNAKSKIGAMGLWQFIPRTARALIHRRDRRQWSDPIRQTKAAALMFKNMKKQLPDWGSTVTSYNSGVGRVKKLLRVHNADGINGLIQIGEEEGGLGFAGKSFYAELLAANLVEAYKTELFFPHTIPISSPMFAQREISYASGKVCRMPPPPSLGVPTPPALERQRW